MKQKRDELKAAIERGIVDNSKAVGKNDGSYHVGWSVVETRPCVQLDITIPLVTKGTVLGPCHCSWRSNQAIECLTTKMPNIFCRCQSKPCRAVS